jgi:hypothetical protein
MFVHVYSRVLFLQAYMFVHVYSRVLFLQAYMFVHVYSRILFLQVYMIVHVYSRVLLLQPYMFVHMHSEYTCTNMNACKNKSHVPILGTILNIFDVFVAVFFSLLNPLILWND